MARIGGGDSAFRYVAIFVFGVLLGTAARAVVWVLPTGFTERLRKRLLVGYD